MLLKEGHTAYHLITKKDLSGGSKRKACISRWRTLHSDTGCSKPEVAYTDSNTYSPFSSLLPLLLFVSSFMKVFGFKLLAVFVSLLIFFFLLLLFLFWFCLLLVFFGMLWTHHDCVAEYEKTHLWSHHYLKTVIFSFRLLAFSKYHLLMVSSWGL